MHTIDITCDCDAKHLTYSVTDSHGVTQLVSFCAECAHGASADWDTDGAIVKIVRDEPTEPTRTEDDGLPPIEFPVARDPALTDPTVHCELESAA